MRKGSPRKGGRLNFHALRGRKGLHQADGLIDAADFVVLVPGALNVLRGKLLAPDFPEHNVKVEQNNP